METTNKTNNTAVIYARVSSVSDRQNTARQVADLNRYAALSGMKVISTFEEHISGAKKNDERPVLCECLDFCEANIIGTLLLSELSRLGRNVWEVQENVKRCINLGLNVYFQKEQFSLFMADGRENPFTAIFVAIIGTCAQMERDNISFRLNSGRANYIANGGKLGRKVGSKEDNAAILSKYPKVVKCLREAQRAEEAGQKPLSLRRIAVLCDCALNTVQKVKKAMNG